MRGRIGGAAALLAWMFAAPALGADDCTPRLVASLDMTPARYGGYAVPAGINGKPYKLIVMTSQPYSFVFDSFAEAAGLRQLRVGSDKAILWGSNSISNYVHLDELTIGPNTGTHISMLIAPARDGADPEIAGIIGTDLLENFDVDLDFKARKLNLFASNSCEGRGVYWSAHYAELPLNRDHWRQISVPMTLDGQTVSVMFNSLAPYSIMAANLAKTRYGLALPPGAKPFSGGHSEADLGAGETGQVRTAPAAPQAEEAGAALRQSGGDMHQFKSLDADGLNIANPLVHFFGNPDAPICDGVKRNLSHSLYTGVLNVTCRPAADLSLGLREMEQLHLYFAYKAGKVYFTAADAN